VKITITLDDDLAQECERRTPDSSWSALIAAALRFAIDAADEAQHAHQAATDPNDAAGLHRVRDGGRTERAPPSTRVWSNLSPPVGGGSTGDRGGGAVPTLSVKVSTDEAAEFARLAKEQDTTVSGLLRHFVVCTTRWRRLEVFDPAVGQPAAWLFLDPGWDFTKGAP
jgi:hypothetical protein